jgi:hypothetical protein
MASNLIDLESEPVKVGGAAVQEAKKEKRSVTNYLEATLASLCKAEASPRKAVREIKEQSPEHVDPALLFCALLAIPFA